jgi:hypothetical protein
MPVPVIAEVPDLTEEVYAEMASQRAPGLHESRHYRRIDPRRSTTDGARFRRCTRCGKDKHDGTLGPMDTMGAANPYGVGY